MFWLLDPTGGTAHAVEWLLTLLDISLKGSFILIVAAGCALAFRRRSAASRHLVWRLALCCVLALSVLSPMLPEWRAPVLPRILPVESNLAEATVHWFAPSVRPTLYGFEVLQAEDLPTAASPASGHPSGWRPSGNTEPTHGASGSGIVLALAVWVVGGLVVFTRLVVGKVGIWCISRRASDITAGQEFGLAGGLSEKLGVKLPQRLRLLKGDGITVPMAWGVWRPRILLPADVDRWTAAKYRAVLLHELAHIQRWDSAFQTLMHVACMLYWFHPLMWFAAHRTRLEGEFACDDRVIHSGVRASDYACHLVDIVRSLKPRWALSQTTIAMARPSQLEQRLLAILDTRRNRRCPRPMCVRVSGIAVACAVLPLAALQPWAREPAAPGEPAERPVAARNILVGGAPPALRAVSIGRSLPPKRSVGNAGSLGDIGTPMVREASEAPVFLRVDGGGATRREPPDEGGRAQGDLHWLYAVQEVSPDSATVYRSKPAARYRFQNVFKLHSGFRRHIGDRPTARAAGQLRRPAPVRGAGAGIKGETRFTVGVGGEILNPNATLQKVSPSVRVTGLIDLNHRASVELVLAYSPLREKGTGLEEVRTRDVLAAGFTEAGRDEKQFMVGVGLRGWSGSEGRACVYYSLCAGVINLPGSGLAMAGDLGDRTGYYLEPRLGLVAPLRSGLSLDVSTGIPIIKAARSRAIQNVLTVGINYSP